MTPLSLRQPVSPDSFLPSTPGDIEGCSSGRYDFFIRAKDDIKGLKLLLRPPFQQLLGARRPLDTNSALMTPGAV